MKTRRPPTGTQAVLRAIRLLKTFTREHPERGLSELCAKLGLAKTTAHRLLGALESEGLVERSPATGGYRLGPGVIALGAQALITSDLRSLARPELDRLAAESGETATLEVLMDDRMLILDEVAGRHLVAAAATVGTHWPIHATSTGKAVLAAMPEERRREHLSTALSRHTSATIVAAAAFRRELERVRELGYATAIEELEEGAVAVGAAFCGRDGEPLGAVSVGGPAARLDRRSIPRLGALVAAAARRLTERCEQIWPETGTIP